MVYHGHGTVQEHHLLTHFILSYQPNDILHVLYAKDQIQTGSVNQHAFRGLYSICNQVLTSLDSLILSTQLLCQRP
jgi:hypothetical protein